MNFGVDYTGGSNCKSRIINKFIRHSTGITRFEYQGVEYRQQLVYIDNSGNQINSSYVGYNSLSPNGIFGDLTFNTGDNSVSEKMRITGDGKIGIRTNDPKEYLQIGSFPVSFTGQSLPITIHKGGSAVIGYNWYYDGADQFFELAKGSSQIRQGDGEMLFQHRKANEPASEFSQSLYLSNVGNVGIKNTNPTYTLDVNGNVRANNAIISSNFTASNIFVDNLRFWYNKIYSYHLQLPVII
ncbi:hypothetical protein EBU71_19715 [bacterium]|nr:hypothetical protein [Candidatus Elulimicrobium humile]